MQRFLETEYERRQLIRFLENLSLPMTVNITEGGKRTLKQNRLNRKWMTEISEQMGDRTPEDIRAYAKLHIGVPILREEDEEYRLKYDAVFKPLPYEQKLALMAVPFDFPVTRLMSTRQQTKYMDEVFRHFSEQGIVLTIPEDGLVGQRVAA